MIHEAVSAIIRRCSTNPRDVREVALEGLDLSSARHVLDLGCGFGFMAEAIAPRVAPDARFVGVDAWASNQELFSHRVTSAGREADFVCMKLGSGLPWPDRCFDVVVCCYSLYFFVDVLPDIARVLSPGGVFVTITHSEESVAGQLPEAGFGKAAEALLALTRRFSAENGEERLRAWFAEVERIDYRNALRFCAQDAQDLLTYLRFKLPLLTEGAGSEDELPQPLTAYARRAVARRGGIVLKKDDAVFRCRQPLCR